MALAVEPDRLGWFSMVDRPVVLRHVLRGSAHGDFVDTLPDTETILARLRASGLRNRDGVEVASAWSPVPGAGGPVACAGDGSVIDRVLLEQSPQAVIDGLLACARVTRASTAVVVVGDEHLGARDAVRAAVRQSRHRLEGVDVQVASTTGDEVARIESAETLSVVSEVVRNGGRADTKAVLVSGAIERPGIVEVPLGTPIQRILQIAGGGLESRTWRMALIGGPRGRVLPAERFETPLSYEALPGMDHAEITVYDESVTPGALARYLKQLAIAGSCGRCSCRVASRRLGETSDLARVDRILATMERSSRCAYGRTVPRPFRDLLEHFGEAALAD